MRLQAYAGASAALAVGTLVKAFSQRPNFYSATVYLSQSNACILILTNLALVSTISFIYGMQRLCYGKLRPIEVEQLSEKAWYAVLDTLLAMPSLRDDVGGWLLVVFVLLLAAKVWGWIGEGRVDTLEQQPPQNAKLFHLRLCTSLVISVLFNAFMCNYCFDSVIADPRPGMMVIFTFEFAIQLVFAGFTACRYILALQESKIVAVQTKQKVEERKAEIRQERLQAIREAGQDESTLVEPTDEDVDENEIDVPGWEEKRRYLFGLELASDCIKLTLYTVFFAISLTFIGLPMHIIRDVYITIANFTKRIQDYSNYKRATQDMNSRYPDATAEELSRENTCIVCRDVMIPWDNGQPNPAAGQPRTRTPNEGLRAKKLPCGHILHLRCLKAWLERQQACPTCRRSVLPPASQARDAQGNLRPPAELFAEAARANAQAVQAARQGQPGAAPQGGPRQPGQPRQNNRMRWLNMGPVRLGFYNGPAGDVQEALRQRQAAADTQPGHSEQRAADPRRCERHLSTEDHLRAVELRLIQQAHNMDVDRAQLATVRALEAELVRLRSVRINSSRGLQTRNIATEPSIVAPAIGLPHVPLQAPIGLPIQRFQAQPAAQPLVNGNEELPPGLVLPEGWSLVPLQRANPGGPQPQSAMPGFPLPMPAFPANANPLAPTPTQPQQPLARSTSTTTTSQPGAIPPASSQASTVNTEHSSASSAAEGPASSYATRPPVSTVPASSVSMGTATNPAFTTQSVSDPPAGSSAAATSSDREAAQAPPSVLQPSPTWGFSGAQAGPSQPVQAYRELGPGEDVSQPLATDRGPRPVNQDTDEETRPRNVQIEDVPDESNA